MSKCNQNLDLKEIYPRLYHDLRSIRPYRKNNPKFPLRFPKHPVYGLAGLAVVRGWGVLSALFIKINQTLILIHW